MINNIKEIIFKHFFPIIPMGAVTYGCPIRLVPIYIPPAKEIRLLRKFQPDSFKTERRVCVETDGQTDMARSTRRINILYGVGNVSFTALQTSD